MRCRLPRCTELVLPWLDAEFCSTQHRLVAMHPEFRWDGPTVEWKDAQELDCYRDRMGVGCKVTCEEAWPQGACADCGGQCDGVECGLHAAGCVFGGPDLGVYWLIADGCSLWHGEAT